MLRVKFENAKSANWTENEEFFKMNFYGVLFVRSGDNRRIFNESTLKIQCRISLIENLENGKITMEVGACNTKEASGKYADWNDVTKCCNKCSTVKVGNVNSNPDDLYATLYRVAMQGFSQLFGEAVMFCDSNARDVEKMKKSAVTLSQNMKTAKVIFSNGRAKGAQETIKLVSGHKADRKK